MPTNDTQSLIPQQLTRIWRDEQRYQKGGVMLADLTPESMQQGDLFTVEFQTQHNDALMQVIDKINKGLLGEVYFAVCGDGLDSPII